MAKRSLSRLPGSELRERRALVRVDFNVPLGPDGGVRDPSRIEAALPTLSHLVEHGARPVLLSHLGRPRSGPDPRYSLCPVVPVLAGLLGAEVEFTGPADSEVALAASRAPASGSVLLLENTRFLAGETENDEGLARRLARLGDLFVQDAFGSTHRAHASTVGVTRFLRPAVAGFLVEAELRALGALRGEDVERPFVVVFGGAKIGDKIELLEELARRADAVLIGGAMANTFLSAAGAAMGASLVEAEALGTARDLAARFAGKIRLPADLVVGDPRGDAPGRVVAASQVPAGLAAVDIGPATRAAYAEAVREARTFFWNGPMGLFEREPFAEGTRVVAQAAAEATQGGAFTVVGGGDSAAALRQAGLAGSVSHVSTGGGASLEYLARGDLPGVAVLDDE